MRGHDAWLQSGNPYEQDYWDEPYCPRCRKPYDNAVTALVEQGAVPSEPYPFCSATCAAEAALEAEAAAEAEAEAWLAESDWRDAAVSVPAVQESNGDQER